MAGVRRAALECEDWAVEDNAAREDGAGAEDASGRRQPRAKMWMGAPEVMCSLRRRVSVSVFMLRAVISPLG